MTQYAPHIRDAFGTRYELKYGKPASVTHAAKWLKRRDAQRLAAYLGSMTTSSTPSRTVSYDRVNGDTGTAAQGTAVVNGGKRPIETVTQQDSSTQYDSDDVNIADMLDRFARPEYTNAYPVDKSGNGGGGALTKRYSVG